VIFLQDQDGIFLSTDNVIPGMRKIQVWPTPNKIYSNKWKQYIWRTWKGLFFQLTMEIVSAKTLVNQYKNKTITFCGNNTFVGTYGGGIYLTTDFGNQWQDKKFWINEYHYKLYMISGNNIFAATNCSAYFFQQIMEIYGK